MFIVFPSRLVITIDQEVKLIWVGSFLALYHPQPRSSDFDHSLEYTVVDREDILCFGAHSNHRSFCWLAVLKGSFPPSLVALL